MGLKGCKLGRTRRENCREITSQYREKKSIKIEVAQNDKNGKNHKDWQRSVDNFFDWRNKWKEGKNEIKK